MEKSQQLNEALRKAVEIVYGHEPHVFYDFHALSSSIGSATGKRVSSTTLRRFWGYQEIDKNISPSRYTLDALAIYAGFKSWDDFSEYQINHIENNSDMIHNESLNVSDLKKGAIVWLSWNPGRQLWVRYLGNYQWIVDKSINAKLSKGYTFCCVAFIKHIPLVLTDVTKDGSVPIIYRCGTEGGIDFHLEK